MPSTIATRARRLAPLLVVLIGACRLAPGQVDVAARAPVIDGFGASTLSPSRANPAARALFAQGMAQVYAFNGAEARRAFLAALARDPACAMCAWGVAYQLGPNINDPDRGDLKEAVRYASYAQQHLAGASARDQALIAALVLRYGQAKSAPEVALAQSLCKAGGGAGERADPLDIAYAQRMRDIQEQFPDDPDVLAIYAEAEMVATRDNWWDLDSGKPAGRIGALADLVEAGLARHPDHVGLNHYMIHVVDAVPVARRAEAAADRLGRLAPKSPHLVHMPAHTYANLGRYADATRVNQAAVAADDAMDRELARQKFSISKDWRSHNLHFQWYGALMEGRGDLALATARSKAARATGDHAFADYERSLPLLTLLQLRRRDAVLAEPLPGGGGLAVVLGNMAHGMALAQAGRSAEAAAAQDRLEAAAGPLLKQHAGDSYLDKMVQGLAGSARLELRAALAQSAGDTAAALAAQQKAVAASKEIDGYGEPPMLAGAPRLRLGAMQLQAKQYAAAEASYRDALASRPHSGWALQGLQGALQAQGKAEAARAIDAQLATSWPMADQNLRAQR